jgi:transposase
MSDALSCASRAVDQKELCMRIVSLDVGKRKTVVDVYEVETQQGRLESITTTPEALHDLLVKEQPDRVVLEVGTTVGWMVDLIRALNIPVQVADTRGEAWKFKNLKRKNDREDARKLSVLSALGQIPEVHVPERPIRQWRNLIGYRQQLVSQRTLIRNRIRATLCREAQNEPPRGKAGWTQPGLAQVRALSKPLMECGPEELWRGMIESDLVLLEQNAAQIKVVETKLNAMAEASPAVRLVRSVPGLGARSAEVIVTSLDNPKRFKTGKQVGAYAGLAPRQYQSGDSDRQGSITRKGNPLLRSMLVEVAWLGRQHNPQIKKMFDHLAEGKKGRKAAAVAVARRLLVMAWAMLRDNKPYDPNRTHGQVLAA